MLRVVTTAWERLARNALPWVTVVIGGGGNGGKDSDQNGGQEVETVVLLGRHLVLCFF